MNMATALNSLLAVLLTALPALASAAPLPSDSLAAKVSYLETPRGEKPRVVITTDPELDDSNSLLRYLLYSSDFKTEGLIYASSGVHWAGDGKGTKFSVPGREYFRFGLKLCPCTSYRWKKGEAFIHDNVEAYAQAYDNLRRHNPDYPSPAKLRSKIRVGNIKFDGEMAEDTPGSDLIKQLLLDDVRSPIYLHAWGGQSTIARALKSIEEEYGGKPNWPQIRAKVISKAIIHPSGDQDDTYAKYIAPHWPEIRYRQWDGGVPLGYSAQDTVSLEDLKYYSADWFQSNIVSKGPLGARQRTWGDGKPIIPGDRFEYFHLAGKTPKELKEEGYIVWTPPHPKGEFLGEGDTHTFLNLIDNGLRGFRSESLGGWGGHLLASDPSKPAPSIDEWLKALERQVKDPDYMMAPAPRGPSHPFIAPAMRDLAARYRWATTSSYAQANHNPRVRLQVPEQLRAKPGEKVRLAATAEDPDGDKVSLKWWPWSEAGTYRGDLGSVETQGSEALFTVPGDAKPGDQIQIVAEATDNGSPQLTRYAKVVVSVE